MKKLAQIVIIAALCIFISVSAVYADGHGWKRFHGTYEMVAKGNGLSSTLGFEKNLTDGFYYPKQGSHVWGSADVAYGTWTFNRDGSGTAGGWNYAIDFPPGHPTKGPRARDNQFYLEFNYNITHEGVITITVTNLPDITYNLDGQVSQDRKTITLYNAYTFLGPNSIFMASRVLIKIGDKQEED